MLETTPWCHQQRTYFDRYSLMGQLGVSAVTGAPVGDRWAIGYG